MRIKNVVLFVSLSCVLVAQVAQAQALLAPVENLVINRAQAAIISRVAIARGFAANDPRIAATLTSMSQASTALSVVSTGAAVGLGFLGAPVWLTIAAGVGILAAGSAIYAGNVTLSRSFDGKTVTAQQPVPQGVGSGYVNVPAADPGGGYMVDPWSWAASVGIPVYHTVSCMPSDSQCVAFPAAPAVGQKNFDFVAGSLELIPNTISQVQQYEQYYETFVANSGLSNSPGADQIQSVSVYWVPNADGTSQTLTKTVSRLRFTCDATSCTWQPKTTVTPLTNYAIGPGVLPISGTDLATIYQSLSPSSLSQPLTTGTLAQLVNQTWQQAAAQPGYQGLPYSVTQPVTATDVAPWAQENPSAMPNVSDLFRPASDPGVSTVTISPTVQPGGAGSTDPSGNPSPGSNVNVINTPNVNVVNKVSVDLGPDPGVQSPMLESPPTISMILSPVLNLLPDVKTWAVPSHSSVCPQPSFTVLGHSYTMTAQCDLAESNRSAIYTVFAAMFTLAAMFIVLRA
ncbi:hypothetical protein PEP31012_00638 [Pandoraea eparura]|uniref:Uncharacterized protein n=1 Tax=Pandoraea eparura TaxID=2508291 RepID=A0A5E4S9D8_9BURK|nr:hypothetical protein [Pandoraea eparura]VVD71683.1 hypothetical protein PEP31012_00638 [Pandoraea eparura]